MPGLYPYLAILFRDVDEDTVVVTSTANAPFGRQPLGVLKGIVSFQGFFGDNDNLGRCFSHVVTQLIPQGNYLRTIEQSRIIIDQVLRGFWYLLLPKQGSTQKKYSRKK